MTPKYQVEWIENRAVMGRYILGMGDSGQLRFPVYLLVVLECPKHIQQCSVESLNHAGSHRMVRCSAGLLHSCEATEAPD